MKRKEVQVTVLSKRGFALAAIAALAFLWALLEYPESIEQIGQQIGIINMAEEAGEGIVEVTEEEAEEDGPPLPEVTTEEVFGEEEGIIEGLEIIKTYTPMDFGPGGGGSQIAVAYNPEDDDVLYIGTDLAGIIKCDQTHCRSLSNALTTRTVYDIEPGADDLYLATVHGIQYSDDDGDTWERRSDGLLGGSPEIKATTVSSLAKQDTFMVAGIGDLIGITDVTVFDPFAFAAWRCDPGHVYLSPDAGQTWKLSLSLQKEYAQRTITDDECPFADADSTGDLASDESTTEAPAVYDVEIVEDSCTESDGETICTEIYVAAGGAGLYYTNNGGTKWYRIGKATAAVTSDGGKTWTQCSDETVGCAARFTGSALCQNPYNGTGEQVCLPISWDINEEVPHVRNVEYVSYEKNGKDTHRIYVTVFDAGIASSCTDDEKASGWKTDEWKDFQGGVYYSDDNGVTWSSMNVEKDGTALGSTIRCSADDRIAPNADYGQLVTDPEDYQHIFVGSMLGRGTSVGVFEHVANDDGTYSWRLITSAVEGYPCYIADAPSKVPYQNTNCYNTYRAGGLWDVTINVNVRALDLTGSGSDAKIAIGTHRTVLQGQYNEDKEQFQFTDVLQYPSNMKKGSFRPLGPNNFCAYGGMEIINGDVVVGGADSSLLLTTNYGSTWHAVRDYRYYTDWTPGPDAHWDETAALVYDDSAERLYFHIAYSKDVETNGIWVSTDNTLTDFVPLGGCQPQLVGETVTCANTAATDNGYPFSATATTMAIDYSSSSSDRRILVGTNDAGIYVYNPTMTGGDQWAKLDGEGCDVLANRHIGQILSLEDEQVTLAAVDDTRDTDSYRTDGVYLITLGETNTCTRLLNSETASCSEDLRGESCDPFDPMRVAVAESDGQTVLLAAGKNYFRTTAPALYSTTIDFNAPQPNWKVTLDFFKNADTGKILTTAGDAWWEYIGDDEALQEEFLQNYYHRNDITAMAVNPNDKEVVLLGRSAVPQYPASQHTYISNDGGQTWEINEDTEDMPYKLTTHIVFDDEGEKIYFLGTCTSLYYMNNPY